MTGPRPRAVEPGQRFDRLTVIDPAARLRHSGSRTDAAALCLCDCGSMTTFRQYALNHGEVRSCGCWTRERSRDQHRSGKAGRMAYAREILAAEPNLTSGPLGRRMGISASTAAKYKRAIQRPAEAHKRAIQPPAEARKPQAVPWAARAGRLDRFRKLLAEDPSLTNRELAGLMEVQIGTITRYRKLAGLPAIPGSRIASTMAAMLEAFRPFLEDFLAEWPGIPAGDHEFGNTELARRTGLTPATIRNYRRMLAEAAR